MRAASCSSSRSACTRSLLGSTSASGPTKIVWPLCERSCTMPRTRALAWAGVERGDQQHQLRALEHAALGGGARQHGPDVGNAVEWWRALGAERDTGFGGERDRGLDGGGVGEWRGLLRVLASHGGAGVRRQERPNGVPFGPAIPDATCPHALPHLLPLRVSESAGVGRVAGINRSCAPGAWPSRVPPRPCAGVARSAFRVRRRPWSPVPPSTVTT